MAAILKVKEAELEAAIKDTNEVDFTLVELTSLTPEELTKRDENMKSEGKKEGKTEGENGAIGILKTELGKKFNKEFKGERLGDVAKELQDLYNSDGNEKLKSAQDQNGLLIKDKEDLEAKVKALEAEKGQVLADYDIMSDFPSDRLNILKEKEYLSAIKGEYSFKEDGVYKGDQLLRNGQTQAALSRKEALEIIFTERSWRGTTTQPDKGGRGGGNSGGGSPTGVKSLSQAVKAWKEADPANNVNEMSPGFQKYLTDVVKPDAQFDMYG